MNRKRRLTANVFYNNQETIISGFENGQFSSAVYGVVPAFNTRRGQSSQTRRDGTKTQFDQKVRIIISDNAFELGTSDSTAQFLSDNSIMHQTTCFHTPQQNGVVERKHKYLLETVRALKFQSNLPTKYWGDCVLTATYIVNRLLSNQVFFGYPFGKKTYKLLNLENHFILTSRDVIFHEDVFPCITDSSNSFRSVAVHEDIDVMPDMFNTTIINNHSVNSHNTTSQNTNNIVPRQASRPSRPPAYLQHYVCPNKTKKSYNTVNDLYCSNTLTSLCENVSIGEDISFVCFNATSVDKALVSIQEPTSYKQAAAFPEW
ncbi:uncharacterized protein LOC141649782 [Silene latifolia]|uniref:uncharacterized protein LOC141649782 n=1 Tax=Silene latifolia TaxID=37657 RepID=UPI003D786338